ncbi:hypothetical protein V5799_008941 [Amblyomma americanum]|uniref:Uncharacterized protein n=1 Tax=Amblyomma americanum TaxID=6943 RepID=A0AAQ4FBM3_AMBAM
MQSDPMCKAPFSALLCGGGVSPYDVCLQRNSSVSADMGFHSDTRKVNGSYYLTTRPVSPYCILHESPSDESTSTTVTDPPRSPR